jgi:hypothetical protein
MRELWTAGAFTDRSDIERTRLRPFIHFYVATIVQLNAGCLKPNPGRVGNAPRRYQYIAAFNDRLA